MTIAGRVGDASVAKTDTATAVDSTARGILAIAVSVIVALAAWQMQAVHATDFAQVWYGARALIAGENPYDVVGPGRAFSWPFPLLYPLTALITAIPFAAIPLRAANVLWAVFNAAILAWALTRKHLWTPKLWVFASAGYLSALYVAQWSPLLTAAALLPSLGLTWVAKPTLGAAFFAAYPSRRAFVGALALVLVSLLAFPSWPVWWMQSLRVTGHMSAPVTHLAAGGPFILLALLKWKRPEARLVAALACVPQTGLLYETVPLFLVVNRWYEGLALSILSIVAIFWPVPPASTSYNLYLWASGNVMVLSLYLPCVVLILTRPNDDASWDALAARCRRTLLRARAEPA